MISVYLCPFVSRFITDPVPSLTIYVSFRQHIFFFLIIQFFNPLSDFCANLDFLSPLPDQLSFQFIDLCHIIRQIGKVAAFWQPICCQCSRKHPISSFKRSSSSSIRFSWRNALPYCFRYSFFFSFSSFTVSIGIPSLSSCLLRLRPRIQAGLLYPLMLYVLPLRDVEYGLHPE